MAAIGGTRVLEQVLQTSRQLRHGLSISRASTEPALVRARSFASEPDTPTGWVKPPASRSQSAEPSVRRGASKRSLAPADAPSSPAVERVVCVFCEGPLDEEEGACEVTCPSCALVQPGYVTHRPLPRMSGPVLIPLARITVACSEW